MAIRLLLKILVFLTIFYHSVAVLDPYIPALRNEDTPRDDLIEQYFQLGFDRSEILACLALLHGIQLSLSQLKRILSRRGLFRSGLRSPLTMVIDAVEMELQGSGSTIGYRSMWQRLVNEHGLVVSRKTVRFALKVLDPTGVESRLRHRLQRRTYKVPGPNYMWHIDGYDKLKPFGFCIHGCIDGYSRRVMWLEVGATNNDPVVVVKYFINCIRQIGGTPRIVRADCGTENVRVAATQRFFRHNCTDGLSGDKSFMYGKSVSNQRIEAWWRQLRKGCTGWWIDHFKSLRNNGLYCDANVIHRECLKFCYMPVIRSELLRAAKLWNTHRIRPSRNQEAPSGRPDILYFVPESHGKTDFKVDVSMDDIETSEDVCCPDDPPGDCLPEFASLAKIIMMEQHVPEMPQSPEKAQDLYLLVVEEIENLL